MVWLVVKYCSIRIGVVLWLFNLVVLSCEIVVLVKNNGVVVLGKWWVFVVIIGVYSDV